jgi:hypothetical protein
MRIGAWLVVLGGLGAWVAPSMAEGPARDGVPAKASSASPVPDPAYVRSDKPGDGATREEGRVSVFKEPSGNLILVVKYPWALHARPSVEVRLLGQGEADDRQVVPMYFRWKHLKGDTTVAVYRCQDGCENAPIHGSVIDGDIEFKLFGDRNSLTKPAVCVARRTGTTALSKVSAQPGSAAAFPLLNAWAVDERLLYLDLPESLFADAGRMRVWFLRNDQVVWSETLDWPGTGNAPPKKAEAASPAPGAKRVPPTEPRPAAAPKEPRATAPKTPKQPRATAPKTPKAPKGPRAKKGNGDAMPM